MARSLISFLKAESHFISWNNMIERNIKIQGHWNMLTFVLGLYVYFLLCWFDCFLKKQTATSATGRKYFVSLWRSQNCPTLSWFIDYKE